MLKKKIILSIAAVCISFAAMAQARIGVKGGLNLSTITVDNSGSVKDNQMLPGWNLGVVADLPLVPRILSFQPGVLYTTKGSKIDIGDKDNPTVTNPYVALKTNPSYIEIPLNFVGKIPVGAHTSIFGGVGPYFAFGVAGKNKVESNTGTGSITTVSNNIKWDDDTPFNNGDPNYGYDKLKRFDWGGNVQVGVETHNVLIAVQYGLGFGKLQSGADNSTDDKGKNRVLSFSVGYLFGGK
ncbi:Outer membrane protein beta-barrel domain-containing protein [Chitinophaga jiangningensis]|uniref:Outer membrane protein beta-barrel domain-containing protein n=1 Tax=Chitinophaga jiangningensis TaxID=1419482 RepID=A0A1M7I149_9BACT|nr:porin family protein [Chitinophaga jiangningensis]SHM34492.1 Outer membrane protein beta-barrel domain-containing protein [Chitinophaga jiangningensis]